MAVEGVGRREFEDGVDASRIFDRIGDRLLVI